MTSRNYSRSNYGFRLKELSLYADAIREHAEINERRIGVPMALAQKQKLSIQMRKRKVTLPTVKWTEQT